MAVVVTLDQPPQGGFGQYTKRGTITLGTYATGGVPVTRSTFSLPVKLDNLQIGNAGGYVSEWDATDGTVKLYWQTGVDDAVLDEIDNAIDVSAVPFRFEASGR